MALASPVSLNQNYGNVITSAPATEPVTAAELRDHLRESATGLPDSEANDLIAEARQFIEDHCGIAMITQSWRMAFDRWPGRKNEPWWDGVREGHINMLYGPENFSDIHLPRFPLASVDTVNVYDEDGTATAVTVATTFDIDTYQRPGRMSLKRGATWPTAQRANNAIEVNYTAGYGASASDVPAPLKRAVKQLAAYLYQNRGDGCGCDTLEAFADSGAASIVSPYKVSRI
jgi:uncharacterized phiE125 gp8 family phage protein